MIDIFTNSPDNSSLSSGVAIFSSQNLAQSKTFIIIIIIILLQTAPNWFF